MIIDVELAVMTYLETNISSVDVTRRKFYDDMAATAISVAAEAGSGSEIPGLVPIGIRVTVRAPKGSEAFALMQQADALLDLMVRKQLTAAVECLGCTRNTHPQPIDGANGLKYFTCLYDCLMRNTA